MQTPVQSRKSKKQHGFVSVLLKWTPNGALKPVSAQHMAPAAQYAMPPPHQPMMYYAAPPPAMYYAAAPGTYPGAAPYPPHPQQAPPAAHAPRA